MDFRKVLATFTAHDREQRRESLQRIDQLAKDWSARADDPSAVEITQVLKLLATAGVARADFAGMIGRIAQDKVLRDRLAELSKTDHGRILDAAQARLEAVSAEHNKIPLTDETAVSNWKQRRDGAREAVTAAREQLQYFKATKKAVDDLAAAHPQLATA